TEPKQTIQAGIDTAVGSGATAVCIDAGTYAETLELASGITVDGGYNSGAGWIKDGSVTRLDASGLSDGWTAVDGDEVSAVRLIDLEIIAADGPTADSAVFGSAGGSSYGIRLVNATNVTISGCTVRAGRGGGGAPGQPGGP